MVYRAPRGSWLSHFCRSRDTTSGKKFGNRNIAPLPRQVDTHKRSRVLFRAQTFFFESTPYCFLVFLSPRCSGDPMTRCFVLFHGLRHERRRWCASRAGVGNEILMDSWERGDGVPRSRSRPSEWAWTDATADMEKEMDVSLLIKERSYPHYRENFAFILYQNVERSALFETKLLIVTLVNVDC